MTFDEAKKAILVADDHFAIKSDKELAAQSIEGKEVNIIFGKDGTTWNYGIPNLYVMDKKDIGGLEDWWKGVHPKTGVMLQPQAKAPGVVAVNLQWESEGGRFFNFHLPVTK